MDNLRRLDLNLLVTLEALLTERSVTRAARRLYLSQPSVSVQLRKLREVFGDPLLAASPGGMLPTARGQALLDPVRAVLSDLRQIVQPPPKFDPGTARVTWQIACADYGEQAIVLPLLCRIRRVARDVRLAILEAGHSRLLKQLEAGTVDLGFMALDSPPQRLRHAVLFKEEYLLVARKRHPALESKLTVAALSRLEYVIVSPEGGGFRGITDVVLERLGIRRKVVLSVPHFLFVPEVVARTDLVAMLPKRLVGDRRGLRVAAPPLAIPGYEMGMVWHERSHLDPAHAWLREEVRRSLAA
ncbi:MAG TPA: LysR family transcriptional regulator [Steroidobacteraceae bacterium]|nr:LysR family transcriptional regulator [Steroidobacteraceae bacterium]